MLIKVDMYAYARKYFNCKFNTDINFTSIKKFHHSIPFQVYNAILLIQHMSEPVLGDKYRMLKTKQNKTTPPPPKKMPPGFQGNCF